MTNTTTAAVRTDLLPELQKRIERKVNRPARKLSLPEAIVTYGEPFPRFYARRKSTIGFEGGYSWAELDEAAVARRETQGKRVWVFEFTPVTIEAAEPKLKGWKFIATIEHTEAGNILRSATDSNAVLPLQYRSSKNVCDHCKTNRRRKDTYLVQHDGFGEIYQVGRTCIKDFLGHGDPEAIARYFDNILSLWSDLDQAPDDESFGRAPDTSTVADFLAVAAESVRVNGWVAKSSWDGYPTASLAWDYLFPVPSKKSRLERYGFDSVTDESIELAKAARDWAVNLEATEHDASDYLYNLKVSCSLELVTGRRTGIVASVISAYQRHLGDVAYRKVEKKRKAEAAPVPVTDERIEITGEVISAKWKQTDFGSSSLKLTINTTEGYRVWGSAPASLLKDGDTQPGDVVTFFAKVVVSDDDKTFGFYKRPTRASYVSRAVDGEVAVA